MDCHCLLHVNCAQVHKLQTRFYNKPTNAAIWPINLGFDTNFVTTHPWAMTGAQTMTSLVWPTYPI